MNEMIDSDYVVLRRPNQRKIYYARVLTGPLPRRAKVLARHPFRRAHEAQEYGAKVAARYERLLSASVETEGAK